MHPIIDRSDLTWHEKLAFLAHRWAPVTDMLVGSCPVKHSFAPGMYVREIFIPAGTIFIGRPHKTGHRIEGVSGRVVLYIDGERFEMSGPFMLHTKAGTQIAAHAITDHVAHTYHANPSECRNVDECEDAAFESADEVFKLGCAVSQRVQELECPASLLQ